MMNLALNNARVDYLGAKYACLVTLHISLWSSESMNAQSVYFKYNNGSFVQMSA